uniref:Hsp90 chaperone protein kinase-targeting subunit n=1 Tax=Strongyloides venezuelensis TaxID=75913 RepID=A0A0K0FNG1_STRVS
MFIVLLGEEEKIISLLFKRNLYKNFIMPIDYSKWGKIEVSDDEDDTHPNIDTPSLYRWRHQARIERMAEQEKKKKDLENEKKDINNHISELKAKLEDTTLDDTRKDEYQKKLDTFLKQLNDFKDKEKQFEEMLSKQPWNVDTISKEKFSKSRINKKTEDAYKPKSPEDAYENMQNVLTKHKKEIEKYKKCNGISEVSNCLRTYPEIVCEEVANYLTLEALNHAIMEEEPDLVRVATNVQYMQYIIQLAGELKIPPNTYAMVNRFFDKVMQTNEAFKRDHAIQLDEFLSKLRHRGKVKRDEALNEIEAEEKAERIKNSPKGIDPLEVLESLPEEMRVCFEERDIEKLQTVATTMDPEVFKYHFQRCKDSGLWVVNEDESNEGGEQQEGQG